MLDSHSHNLENWGIRPTLFEIGNFKVSSYSFFVLLGLAVGLFVVYLYSKNEKKEKNEYILELVLVGIIGGILGAKLPIWIYYFPQIVSNFSWQNMAIILAGRTITGGLIGGTVAVWITKRRLGIKNRLGNSIVFGVIVGIAIGRVGCFLQGCCFGRETSLPWGVNFGDGIFRHPTEIYEIIFLVILFVYFNLKLRQKPKEGVLFDQFMIAYFFYRFVIEFIRVEPKIFLNLTMFQYLSLLVIFYFVFFKKKLNSLVLGN